MHSTLRIVAASVAALLVTAAPGHGQIGALKKIKKTVDNVSSKTETASATGSLRSPAASADLVKIASPSIDQFLKGLTAELAEADRHKADSAAFATKKQTYNACIDAKRVQDDKDEKARRAAGASMEPQIQAMTKRAQAAAQAGDMKTMKIITDSMTAMMMAAQNKVGPGHADCGDSPEDPFSRMGRSKGSSLASAGASAAGLTARQYAMLRERIAHWVLVNGKIPPGTQWAYWEDELQAMNARAAELTPHYAYFRGSNAESMWGMKD